MLVIRTSQMARFAQHGKERFETRMIAHLFSCFSGLSETLTESQLRDLVRWGVDRAEERGLTDETDVERYLEFMMLYGPDFDSHPEYAWAAEILADAELSGEEKMDKIQDRELFGFPGK